jgi:hypothetical protein
MIVYLLVFDNNSEDVREVYECEADAHADAAAANAYWSDHDGSAPYYVRAMAVLPAGSRLLRGKPGPEVTR